MRLGTAPDSWGVWFADDPRQTPWRRYLDECTAAGYEWTELGPYGYLPADLPTLKRELESRGLKACGTALMVHLEDDEAWPETERQLLGAGELLAGLGARYLVLIDDTYSNLFTGEPTRPKELDPDGWQRLVDTTHRVATIAKRRFGLTTVFHPHAETHIEYERQIERFLSDTDAGLVQLCFDTGHHAYRGGDPIAFVRKYQARIPYLHLKSVDPEKQRWVAREGIPFAHAVAEDMFCEPSRGTVDFLAFRDLLKEIGYDGFAIVEQDMYPAAFDKPLPIAKRTREYLVEIGLG